MSEFAPPATSITTALPLLLLLTYLSNLHTIHAQQSPRPTPKYSTFNTFVDGRGLFIGGGYIPGETNAGIETFMIDLSANWTTSNPKYEELSAGFPVGSANTISPDGKLWLVSYGTQIYAYNFEKKTWGTESYLELSRNDSEIRHFGAVTDVENGLVYIPNAFPNYMMRINTAGPSYDKVPMPSQMNETSYLSVVWSAYSQKMYLLGGMSETEVLQDWKAFSYSSTEGWINLSTSMKGTVPAFRGDACFVPAYDGTKMVFFGGYDDGLDVAFGDIFVLDVATLTWTKGPSVPANDRRGKSACAASGDYFISWLGRGTSGVLTNSILSYDLKASRWTTTYIAPPPSATRTPRSGPTSSPTSPGSPPINNPDNSVVNSPPQVAVIVGSVLGVVAVVIVAVGFLLYRVRGKRARNSIKNSVEPPSTPSTDNTDPSSPGTKSPRNPHFAPLIHNPTSDGRVPSQRGPQERISQQLWPQKEIPSSPHSPTATSGSFHPFSYPISHSSLTHSPQEGSMEISWITEGPHSPHKIVKGHSMYQGGLSDYSDFSPMTVSSYEDKGSYKDTDLILMNRIEDSGIYRPQ
ncbi:hypothetical protein BGX34_006798 [Mortierella sp. NVP85]|nr:hypothetical protein BGX34_006798 [Mortierella sp. NVP85]